MEKRLKFTMKLEQDVLDWLYTHGDTLTFAINNIVMDRYNQEKNNIDKDKIGVYCYDKKGRTNKD